MTAFIGREQELDTLSQALERARQGNGSCWMLVGEAGIGKSRLLDEIKVQAASQHFDILQGNCFQQDASLPYAPWMDALRLSFASLSTAEIRQALGPLASEISKLLPELRLLIPDAPPNPPLEPAAEKYRSFESIARVLLPAGAARPSLIILEDLHWSDSLSLELFHFLVRRISDLPVMLIGTYRSDELSAGLERLLSELNRERLGREIVLKPLSQNEVEQMVHEVLRTDRRIPSGIVDALRDLTDGNPFFLDAVLKSMTEEGDIDALFRHTRLEELPIPRSIQRLVQQRVAKLPEATRSILIYASVIGERVDFELLQEISQQEERKLLQALKELMLAHLIVQDSAEQFVFRHALLRQAVYSTLMLRERKAMHQMIGQTMERMAGMRRDEAAQLAYHFYQAEEWQKAMDYSQRAAQQAQALYAPREALAHFTYALNAARHIGLPPPLSLLRGRGHAHEVLGEFEPAYVDYENALEWARRGTDRAAEWQARIDLGLLWQSRDLERAGAYYRQALELARHTEDSALLARSLNRIGNWHLNQGQASEALSLHRDALDLFRRQDDRQGTAQTLDLLGVVSYVLGEAVQGAEYLEQAAPIFRELNDRQGLVNVLTNLTLRTVMDTEVLGNINYLQLSSLSEEALQIARGFHWYQGEALALMQGASCLQKAGAYGQALERLAQARLLLEESQDRELLARLHLMLGTLSMDLLDLIGARRHLETALTVLRKLGSGLLLLSATAHLAAVTALEKDFAHARALLTDVLPAEYPQGRELLQRRRCWSVRAELELVEGHPDRALEILDRLLATTPNLPQYGPHAVPYLSLLRGRALAALGRVELARVELQGALPVAQAQGRYPLVWRLHVSLGRVFRAIGRRADAEREYATARDLVSDLANLVPDGALRQNFLQQALATMPAAAAPTPLQTAKMHFGGLTAREREIAALIARAKSNREIADLLVISEKTTERHVANILKKLDFNSRTQIATWAVEKGLSK